MNMEVEITSKSYILPSSPTPPHLRTYKISLLDQFIPTGYFPVLLIFPNSHETNTNAKRSLLLKQSLSESLSRFYPLAGKIKDNLSVDCNDEGVCYIEAKCNILLSNYLNQSDFQSLNKLSPNELTFTSTLMDTVHTGSPVASIQETTFGCGGFAICIYVSHMVCDGPSIFLFLKDWAVTTAAAIAPKSGSLAKYPFWDGESIFPQYISFPKGKNNLTYVDAHFPKKGKQIRKRIVFTESAIANLKAKAISENKINNPTRVEVVTVILCKSLMSSFKKKTGTNTSVGITHAVNLRRKMEPPLPECSMGNFVRLAAIVFTTKEDTFGDSVSQVREATKNVDCEFLKKMRSGEDGYLKFCDEMKKMEDLLAIQEGFMQFAAFSSWCNFDAYDIDFGWGKPIWVPILLPFKNDLEVPVPNLIALMDTRTKKGIEAWVSMKEDEFNFLEKDEELLQYALIDPPPLIYN